MAAVSVSRSPALGAGSYLRARARAATIPAVDTEITDGELIVRVARRDERAFGELYRRYARPVLGLALRRIGDRGRAEDAVQETFASLWRAAARYDPAKGPGAPWLYTVARNTVIDMLRRTPEYAIADAPEQVSDEPAPPDAAEAGWASWRVHRAIASLPEGERVVIELAYWSGLSQSEVASFLGVPLGTVKTRTRSALGRLADLLDGDLR
ncbi:MAG: sigma-70 family RNA polymerase sigma factor [Gaiellales bacterium]